MSIQCSDIEQWKDYWEGKSLEDSLLLLEIFSLGLVDGVDASCIVAGFSSIIEHILKIDLHLVDLKERQSHAEGRVSELRSELKKTRSSLSTERKRKRIAEHNAKELTHLYNDLLREVERLTNAKDDPDGQLIPKGDT